MSNELFIPIMILAVVLPFVCVLIAPRLVILKYRLFRPTWEFKIGEDGEVYQRKINYTTKETRSNVQ